MPVDLYLEQIHNMAAIRWSTALPDNNIATALFPLGFPLHDSFRLPSNRRAAFSKAGGMKLKTWDSTSCTSVQRILPIDDVARRAMLLFSKWPVPRKPNIWLPPDPDECEYVTGAPYREVNSKVATAPKLQVEDKDKVNNSRRIKTVKLNIVKLNASLNKFSRGKLVIEVECQTLKLK